MTELEKHLITIRDLCLVAQAEVARLNKEYADQADDIDPHRRRLLRASVMSDQVKVMDEALRDIAGEVQDALGGS